MKVTGVERDEEEVWWHDVLCLLVIDYIDFLPNFARLRIRWRAASTPTVLSKPSNVSTSSSIHPGGIRLPLTGEDREAFHQEMVSSGIVTHEPDIDDTPLRMSHVFRHR